MSPEQEQKLDEVRDCVVRLDTTLMSRGGVLDRIERVEAKVVEHDTLKTKALAWCSIISIAAGVVAQWAKDKLIGK